MTTEYERRLSDEQNAALAALKTAAGPEHTQLINRLSNCAGAAMAVGENRVLRIVGVTLAQHDLGDLFEEIYRVTNEGCQVDYGDGRLFLQYELGVA